MRIDAVYVISLERRPDRLSAFWRDLPTDWALPEIQVWKAIDGKTLTVPRNRSMYGSGAYGCAMSHISLLEHTIMNNLETVLILEDDAVFSEDFCQKLALFNSALPDSWQMLMLGGHHAAPPRLVASGVVRTTKTLQTHAYVVRGSVRPILLDVYKRATGHIDQEHGKVMKKAETYAPDPFLVYQRGCTSDVS